MTLLHGDLMDVLPTLAADSLDACVTDPPYDYKFMGKAWDGTGIAFDPDTWRAVYCVLKPGAHLVAFGGTRTSHRMVCAIEDAGFEIRDSLCWLYGSGFPKSLDVGKAIDKAAGAERQVIGQYVMPLDSDAGNRGKVIRSVNAESMFGSPAGREGTDITAPATAAAKQWSGWGTALKPAHEPIVLARKPFIGTVAENVLQHGTGALNIDGCRIGEIPAYTDRPRGPRSKLISQLNGEGTLSTGGAGRWPANVLLDEDAAEMLDEQTGELSSHGGGTSTGIGYGGGSSRVTAIPKWDSGGASRFFYCAKASRTERGTYLSCDCETPNIDEWVYEDQSRDDQTAPTLPEKDISEESSTDVDNLFTSGRGSNGTDVSRLDFKSTTSTAINKTIDSTTYVLSAQQSTSGSIPVANGEQTDGGSPAVYVESSNLSPLNTSTSQKKAGRSTGGVVPAISAWSSRKSVCGRCGARVKQVSHPTVKPLALMRWLVRLVTPPNGIVLDPFSGSGTTGMACRYENRDFILIEKEQDYIDIATKRIASVAPLYAEDHQWSERGVETIHSASCGR